MKTKSFVLVFAALFLALSFGAWTKKTTLHVYTWADYIKPQLVKRFEKENNCKVIIDTFDSNEAMYAKLNAGATGYDIITPTTYMVKVMHEQKLLQDFDHSKLPNAKYVDQDYLKLSPDAQMSHSVPYMCGSAGIAYNKEKVVDSSQSWGIFDKEQFKGRMTMFNDMRETIGAALKFLGYSLNTTDEKQLEEAKQLLFRWKKNLAKFENEQYKTGIASGEFTVVHGYSGDILQVQDENPNIGFFIPTEGTTVSCDEFVIPKTAKETELAHKFVNFLHDPDVAAQNIDFLKWLCPNTEAYKKLSPEILENPAIFMKPEVRARCEIIADLGPENAKYIKVWDEVKGAE